MKLELICALNGGKMWIRILYLPFALLRIVLPREIKTFDGQHTLLVSRQQYDLIFDHQLHSLFQKGQTIPKLQNLSMTTFIPASHRYFLFL